MTGINISMKKYHSNLKLPVPFVPFEKGSDHFDEVPITDEHMSPEFLNWLAGMGLTFRKARFFNSIPNQQYRLHVDGDVVKELVKLNIVFDSTDTIMNWYEPVDGYQGTLKPNGLGQPVLYYDKDKCNLLHSKPVNTHCILAGNIVHDLVNGPNNGQSRKCYSMFLVHKATDTLVKWDEALELFGPHLID